jgi:hypothetical protein
MNRGTNSAAGLMRKSSCLSQRKELRAKHGFSYTNPPPAARLALVFSFAKFNRVYSSARQDPPTG